MSLTQARESLRGSLSNIVDDYNLDSPDEIRKLKRVKDKYANKFIEEDEHEDEVIIDSLYSFTIIASAHFLERIEERNINIDDVIRILRLHPEIMDYKGKRVLYKNIDLSFIFQICNKELYLITAIKEVFTGEFKGDEIILGRGLKVE